MCDIFISPCNVFIDNVIVFVIEGNIEYFFFSQCNVVVGNMLMFIQYPIFRPHIPYEGPSNHFIVQHFLYCNNSLCRHGIKPHCL